MRLVSLSVMRFFLILQYRGSYSLPKLLNNVLIMHFRRGSALPLFQGAKCNNEGVERKHKVYWQLWLLPQIKVLHL